MHISDVDALSLSSRITTDILTHFNKQNVVLAKTVYEREIAGVIHRAIVSFFLVDKATDGG